MRTRSGKSLLYEDGAHNKHAEAVKIGKKPKVLSILTASQLSNRENIQANLNKGIVPLKPVHNNLKNSTELKSGSGPTNAPAEEVTLSNATEEINNETYSVSSPDNSSIDLMSRRAYDPFDWDRIMVDRSPMTPYRLPSCYEDEYNSEYMPHSGYTDDYPTSGFDGFDGYEFDYDSGSFVTGQSLFAFATSDMEVKQSIDPNSIWEPSSEATEQAHTPKPHRDEALLDADRLSVELTTLRDCMNEFWVKHSQEFIAFWTVMRSQNREIFLRYVHPSVVHSVQDRYCIEGGSKVYEVSYDKYLFLAPEMTVEYLAGGNNLVDLVHALSQLATMQSISQVTVRRLRGLIAQRAYPLTTDEAASIKKEVPLRKGSFIRMDTPEKHGALFGVDRPEAFLNSSSDEFKLFERGCMMHQYEFGIVADVLHYIYTIITQLIDEFQSKVLGTIQAAEAVPQCGFCGKEKSEEVVLRQCSQCKVQCYCSADCQKNHWPVHKTPCKRMKLLLK